MIQDYLPTVVQFSAVIVCVFFFVQEVAVGTAGTEVESVNLVVVVQFVLGLRGVAPSFNSIFP